MANIEDPVKQTYSILTFVQNGVSRVYSNWSGTLPSTTSIPSLEVRVAPNTGTFDDKPTTIEFPQGADAWLDGLYSPSPAAPVTLSIIQIHYGIGPAASEDESWSRGKYRLMRAIRNPEKRAGVARLEFLSAKGRMALPLGIAATPGCAWTLGDKTCGGTGTGSEGGAFSLVTETGTIADIQRKRVFLTDPTDLVVVSGKLWIAGPNTGYGALDLDNPPTKDDPDDRYWVRGVMSFEGLSIGIRDWDQAGADPYMFELVREPPAGWLNQVVTLRPGCDKTPQTCLGRFDNLRHFGGFGWAIPAYQVVLETP